MRITRLLTIAPTRTLLVFVLLILSSVSGIFLFFSISINSSSILIVFVPYIVYAFIVSISFLAYINKVSSSLDKSGISWNDLPLRVREEIISFTDLMFLIFGILCALSILSFGVREFNAIIICTIVFSMFLLISSITLLAVEINPYELALYTKFWQLFQDMKFRMYVPGDNVAIFIGHDVSCIIRKLKEHQEKGFEIYILKDLLLMDTPDSISYEINKYETLEDTHMTTIKFGEVILTMKRAHPVRRGVIWMPNKLIEGKALILKFKILSSESPRVFASRVMEVFQYALNKYYGLLTPVDIHYLSI